MKGIAFSDPLAPLVFDGTKTQTRRIIHDVDNGTNTTIEDGVPYVLAPMGEWLPRISPYGTPGDILYVRETHYRYGHWEPVAGVQTKTGRQKWQFVADTDEVLFGPPAEFRKGRHHKDPATPAWHKRLARFMPSRVARTRIEIVSVCMEQLQDISRGDAMAEGCPFPNLNGKDVGQTDPVGWFRELWEIINGQGSWDLNPHVWVLNFRRVQNEL